MKRIATILAALAMPPLAAACGEVGPDATAATVTIPFAPPLDRPLHYRTQHTEWGAAGDSTTSRSLFTVRFSRAGDDLVMSVSALDPDGGRQAERGFPAALAERRFRVGPDGALLGMDNEEAYWAAVRSALAPRGPSEAETRESREMLETARRNQAQPAGERMLTIAQDAWPVTFYAGDSFTRAPREARITNQTILGLLEGTSRTFAREISGRRIVIVESFTIDGAMMQAALDGLVARYGRRPDWLGSRHISSIFEVTTDLDPRTGLVLRRIDRQEIVSEEAGRTLRHNVTNVLERIDMIPPLPTQPPGNAAMTVNALSER